MRLSAIATLTALSFAGVLSADSSSAQPPPYPAPDFTVNMPDGKPIHISSLRGKVVLVECIFTTCQHCQDASRIFTKLYQEYGPRGFQPVAAAFNDELWAPNTAPASLVTAFSKSFGVTYPVGWSDRSKVLEFLGIRPFDRFVVPQLVWIDRKGMVRSKTLPSGNDENQRVESFWREMIETLLKEPATSAAHKPAAHHSASAVKK